MPLTISEIARDFQARFGGVVRDTPTVVPDHERDVLLSLLAEELTELVCATHGTIPAEGAGARVLAALLAEVQAAHTGERAVDLHDVMLETADLLIVAATLGSHYGFDIDAVCQVKHASNLSKLGPDGQPVRRHDGKILKGPLFRPPDRSRLPG